MGQRLVLFSIGLFQLRLCTQVVRSRCRRLAGKLTVFSGVEAVTVLPEEGSVLLKVSQTGWDEEGVRHLLQGGH